jgi:hypothetical protein
MAQALPFIAMAATTLGGIKQAAAVRSAAAQNKMQLDYMAGQELAAGQYAAEASRKKGELMLSRAHAVAAASGGGPLDESLAAGIFSASEKAAGFDTYQSTEKAKGMQYKGDVGVRSAKVESDAILLNTIGKVAGMSSFSPGGSPNGFTGNPAQDWATSGLRGSQ